MQTCLAYCSACDAEVLVRYDPDRPSLSRSDVECPELGEVCSRACCVLEGMSDSQLRENLEFLPEHLEADEERDFGEAVRQTEQARRVSLGREYRRGGNPSS